MTTKQDYTYTTIDEVKLVNAEIGHFWFTKETMKFFNSRVESELLKGKYFVTSERQQKSEPKLYTIRKALPDGSIVTECHFRSWPTLKIAIQHIKLYLE